MDKITRWGIIGPGKIAEKFARDLSALPNARLQAVASRSLERARLFADKFQVPHFFEQYEAMLDSGLVDAVYIATPHTGHHPCALLCLERNIPVLCEKPIAVNARQTREMIAAARHHQTFLMEALWTRFLPSIQQVLEILQSGALGTVTSIKADFGFLPEFDPHSRLFDLQLAGGALLDVGIYPLFLAHLLLGKPTHISALGVLGSTGVDEETGILLRFPNDAMAHLHTTIRSHTKTEAYIYCTHGTIYLHTRWYSTTTMSILRHGHPPTFHRFDYRCGGFSYQIEEVMRCLNQGLSESPALSLDFSLSVMETMDTIRQQIGLVYPADETHHS